MSKVTIEDIARHGFEYFDSIVELYNSGRVEESRVFFNNMVDEAQGLFIHKYVRDNDLDQEFGILSVLTRGGSLL